MAFDPPCAIACRPPRCFESANALARTLEINRGRSPSMLWGCSLIDDVLHRALGLKGHDWQSLYHFTVGNPVEDLRLRTAPPYAHLDRAEGE